MGEKGRFETGKWDRNHQKWVNVLGYERGLKVFGRGLDEGTSGWHSTKSLGGREGELASCWKRTTWSRLRSHRGLENGVSAHRNSSANTPWSCASFLLNVLACGFTSKCFAKMSHKLDYVPTNDFLLYLRVDSQNMILFRNKRTSFSLTNSGSALHTAI